MKPGIVVQPAAILEDEAPGEQITAILKAARDTAIAARNEPMTPGTGSGSEEAAE